MSRVEWRRITKYAVQKKNFNEKVSELESLKKKNELLNTQFISLANQKYAKK